MIAPSITSEITLVRAYWSAKAGQDNWRRTPGIDWERRRMPV